MAALITNVGLVFSAFITWAGNVGSMIVDTPILLFGFGIFVVGAGVGMFSRLLHRT